MIRLVVADDHPQMMQAIRRLCASYGDIQIVAEAARFAELRQALQSHAHDVILIDDHLPPASSAEPVATLREAGITTPILVMSVLGEPHRIRRVLHACANGYIVKREFVQELQPAIRAVHRGESYLSPSAVAALEEEEE